jgi:outer membrane biosynthesis protein TonB
MICLCLVDNIVHGTLYNYGLQFSYDWAVPYWRLTQIAFALGWINIITAFAIQANNLRMKRKTEQPTAVFGREGSETKKAQEESTSAKEHKEVEPAKPPEEKLITTPKPEAQENEEPKQSDEESEQESQLPEDEPDEIPSLASLFETLPPERT